MDNLHPAMTAALASFAPPPAQAQHTPGPWTVRRQNPSPTTGEWMIAGSKPGYLAEVRDCGSGNVQANARLIAAAPDLLETLKMARASLKEHLDWLIGFEKHPAIGFVASQAAILIIESDQDLLNQIDAAIAKAEGGAA